MTNDQIHVAITIPVCKAEEVLMGDSIATEALHPGTIPTANDLANLAIGHVLWENQWV
jgi:hypothetical protein